jgi:hypothetical protein
VRFGLPRNTWNTLWIFEKSTFIAMCLFEMLVKKREENEGGWEA